MLRYALCFLALTPAAAAADVAVRAAATNPAVPSSVLDVEGFRLGEPLADLRARLERGGWKVKERANELRGVAYVQLIARAKEGPVRRVRVRFLEGRAALVRVYFRSDARERGTAFHARCDGLDRLGRSGANIECVDSGRTIGWRVHRKGRYVEVADLAAILAKGIVTRERIERMVQRARR